MSGGGINVSSIVVVLNGVTVSNLVITGTSTDYHVSAPGLQPNTYYTVSISFAGILGGGYSTSFSFDTVAPGNYQWEAADWDYTANGVSGLFIDNRIDAYGLQANPPDGLQSTEGIDVQETYTQTTGNPFDYRINLDGSLLPSQEPSGDVPRSQFGTNTQYKIDWFGNGSWCNYTRHYPAGTYYVLARVIEGGSATVANLWKVTSGFGTANQNTTLLGTFNIPFGGSWATSESVYLEDNSGNPVKVTFDGTQTTLRFSGNPVAANDPTINADYFMLVPAPSAVSLVLSAKIQAGNIGVSFQTHTGSNYQVQYKNHLTDASWTPLGSPIAGNNAVQSVSDPSAAGSRFYRVEVQ
jgi:hypothetical protein